MQAYDSYKEPINKIRNRIESGKVNVYNDMIISDACKWKENMAIVWVERQKEVFNTKKKQWNITDEISYYVSTTPLSAEVFCKRGQRTSGHRKFESSCQRCQYE